MRRLAHVVIATLGALLAFAFGLWGASPASAVTPPYTYDVATYNYDGALSLSAAHAPVEAALGSPAGSRAAPGVSHVSIGRCGVAANTAETVAINGEMAATAFGRQMHATWDYGPGFVPEFTLKAGGRVDGINFGTREVIELKPNNPRAIRLGNQQLEGYLAKLNVQFPGEPWTGRVVTYDR